MNIIIEKLTFGHIVLISAESKINNKLFDTANSPMHETGLSGFAEMGPKWTVERSKFFNKSFSDELGI